MEKRKYELIRPEDLLDLHPNEDTHYIFSTDFQVPIENVTEEENRIAQKYLSLFAINLENTDQLIFSLQAVEVYNLFVCISREKPD